jgi:hypothetical protein
LIDPRSTAVMFRHASIELLFAMAAKTSTIAPTGDAWILPLHRTVVLPIPAAYNIGGGGNNN